MVQSKNVIFDTNKLKIRLPISDFNVSVMDDIEEEFVHPKVNDKVVHQERFFGS